MALRVRRAQQALVAWCFERLYREFAWSYDAVASLVSRGYWQRWARSALLHLPVGPVLELGCGTGTVQLALASSPRAHLGIDRSPTMAGRAAQRLRNAGYQPRVARAVAQALPVANQAVAAVMATFPSPYILDPATLQEIQRVLHPGGRLVVVASAVLDADDPIERLIDLAYRLTLQGSARSTEPVNLRLDAFEAAGFAAQAVWEPVGASRVLLIIADAADA